jgi:hypothetical protein
VIAITKCLISVPLVNRFTVLARAVKQCDSISDWMVGAGVMETTTRLIEAGLDAISGGSFALHADAVAKVPATIAQKQ